jgi:dTDP-4-dehydrorhamnose reductase
VFHVAGDGSATWHDVAVAAVEAAAALGYRAPLIEPITTAEWPTAARRPLDSRLDCGLAWRRFGVRLPPWRDSLRRTVGAIAAAEATPAEL